VPEPHNPPRSIAIANQKGGVGKTTTAINLAATLCDAGCRVLLLDLDPQGNASTGLGFGRERRGLTTYDLLMGHATLAEVAQPTEQAGLLLCPSSGDLSSVDIELVGQAGRLSMLRQALKPADLEALAPDYILLDCPPSLNLLTLNALVASQSVLIPLQCEFYALEGLSQLMLTVREIRQAANRDLRIEGIVLTMYDTRNKLSGQVEAEARANLQDLVFRTTIPRNVRLSEAPSHALPITLYDPDSRGCQAYRSLAEELIDRHRATRAA